MYADYNLRRQKRAQLNMFSGNEQKRDIHGICPPP